MIENRLPEKRFLKMVIAVVMGKDVEENVDE